MLLHKRIISGTGDHHWEKNTALSRDCLKVHSPLTPVSTVAKPPLPRPASVSTVESQGKQVRQCPTFKWKTTKTSLQRQTNTPDKQSAEATYRAPSKTAACRAQEPQTAEDLASRLRLQRAHIGTQQMVQPQRALVMSMPQEGPDHPHCICASKHPMERQGDLPQHNQVMQKDRTGVT